tara:strand:+ start:3053 stop:3919 length:867 start_codon:yes stop_codon:yes gene_type:complete
MQYTIANKAKASFDDVYNARTPHAYLAKMAGLGYRIGDHATPFFSRAINHARRSNGPQGSPTILDVGCSYGIGSALVLHQTNYDSLSAFFTSEESESVDACIARATEWLAQRRSQPDVKCIGLDQAKNAVAFAKAVGLVEQGIAKNLEAGDTLSTEETASIQQCNLLFSTGVIGYVGPKTLAPVLAQLGKATQENVGPFIVTTILRMFDPSSIMTCFQEHGFRFERLSHRPLPQRNFESPEEQQQTLAILKQRGIATDELEDNGQLYADIYVGARKADFVEFTAALIA